MRTLTKKEWFFYYRCPKGIKVEYHKGFYKEPKRTKVFKELRQMLQDHTANSIAYTSDPNYSL